MREVPSHVRRTQSGRATTKFELPLGLHSPAPVGRSFLVRKTSFGDLAIQIDTGMTMSVIIFRNEGIANLALQNGVESSLPNVVSY